ncbi:MAG: glycosyltransferase family 4 protein [Ferruginibacter sp.]
MKKLLVISPFETIYPPVNGGMHRCIHVLDQLSKYFDVSAIMHQRSADFLESVKEFPSLRNLKVYSTHDYKNRRDLFSLLPHKVASTLRTRLLVRSWKSSADSSLLRYHGILKFLLKQNRYDVIVLEKLSTLNAVPLIRHYNKKACIVYNSHNIDSNLAMDKLESGTMTTADYLNVKKSESTLYDKVDALFVCSSKDLKGYEQLNKRSLNAAVIPNGVKLFSASEENNDEDEQVAGIIFCGTLSYFPNVQGLLWFYDSIWPAVKKKFPGLKLTIIGSGTAPAALALLKTDPSILFIGRVDDVKAYYDKAAVSIVPLKAGSGTRLKILESMNLGVPVISTSKGAEGIEYEKDKNIIIADSEEEFAGRLINLVSQKEERVLLKRNARLLVRQKYDWDVIGKGLQEFIEQLSCN